MCDFEDVPEDPTEAAIQRLRMSKKTDAEQVYGQGEHDGRAWAMEHASHDDLCRLTELVEGPDWPRFFDGAPMAPLTWGGAVLKAIDPVDFEEGGDVEYWQVMVGDDWRHLADNPVYVRGFAEGAVSCWREVRDRVDE